MNKETYLNTAKATVYVKTLNLKNIQGEETPGFHIPFFLNDDFIEKKKCNLSTQH